MKVVFIGAGNVATHLAAELHKYSFTIEQIYSRSIESATLLAEKVGATPIIDLQSVSTDADLYIFSVKDSVLQDIIPHMPSNDGIWVHTAGSIPINVFSGYTSRYGVLYPFQTFTKDRILEWLSIPIFLEGSDTETLDKLRYVASCLSNTVTELSSDDREYLHLTGVFACNFTNHMYRLSEIFLDKINLPFHLVLPLIDETASKIHSLSPDQAQTGPAIRYDENVINRHLALIDDEQIREIYKLISENIHQINKR